MHDRNAHMYVLSTGAPFKIASLLGIRRSQKLGSKWSRFSNDHERCPLINSRMWTDRPTGYVREKRSEVNVETERPHGADPNPFASSRWQNFYWWNLAVSLFLLLFEAHNLRVCRNRSQSIFNTMATFVINFQCSLGCVKFIRNINSACHQGLHREKFFKNIKVAFYLEVCFS